MHRDDDLATVIRDACIDAVERQVLAYERAVFARQLGVIVARDDEDVFGEAAAGELQLALDRSRGRGSRCGALDRFVTGDSA